jgi:hypothetical protein
MQKNQLEYQEMILSEDLNKITQEMSDTTEEHSGDTDYNPDNDLAMRELEYQQQLYDSEKSSIESQLKEINAEIDSYDKAVDTNIKSECKFTISAG